MADKNWEFQNQGSTPSIAAATKTLGKLEQVPQAHPASFVTSKAEVEPEPT